VLITSGPTRQYVDPVRFLSNESSGRMGQALAEAVVSRGLDAVVVSGPVSLAYPREAQVIAITTTDDLLAACMEQFPRCDALIAAAAPCDFRPEKVADQKISKSGRGLTLQLVETPDVLAALAAVKGGRPVMGFALETEQGRQRAALKLKQKNCDFIVLNSPQSLNQPATEVEVIDRSGEVVATFSGSKGSVARALVGLLLP
jgi:phosphopantothenoylcysteine decarboxylase/phosphopantothenate--cysteine ligase